MQKIKNTYKSRLTAVSESGRSAIKLIKGRLPSKRSKKPSAKKSKTFMTSLIINLRDFRLDYEEHRKHKPTPEEETLVKFAIGTIAFFIVLGVLMV